MAENQEKKTLAEGTGLALGLSLGVVFGVTLGTSLDNLGTWLAVGISLGLVFGLAYDDKLKKQRQPEVTIVDGASYTLLRHVNPALGQRHHCWVGDNGAEIELTDEEATARGLD